MAKATGKIRFIGTGSMFDVGLGNASALVDLPQGRVLIDCGFTVYERLLAKSALDTVDYLLLTHLHGDHVGSIHPLLLYWAFVRKRKITFLYPTEGFKRQVTRYLKTFLSEPEDYLSFVNLKDIKEIGYINTKGHHMPDLQTYAYFFNTEDQFIYYSGDLGSPELTAAFLKTIRHENILVFHEATFFHTKAHSHYKDIERLLAGYRVYLYHCNHLIAPEDCQLPFAARQKDFLYI